MRKMPSSSLAITVDFALTALLGKIAKEFRAQ
jgi:hypothetical protein